jgi:peroxiredoxin
MSDAHAKTCVVQLGDPLPSLTLQGANEEPQSLEDLLGPRLTVVLFWSDNLPYAQEQFLRLGREVVRPFGKYGVHVIAVHVGQPQANTPTEAVDGDASLVRLSDPDSRAFEAVATQKLPRTYLLDPSGKILWLDIEYSESTRRELRNAIVWHLTEKRRVASRPR